MTSRPIRVLVADDQQIVRDGLAVLVGASEDFVVVGVAEDGLRAVAVAVAARPDVVLMDIRMPVLDGIAATRRILSEATPHGLRVLVLTTFDDDRLVFEAFRAGASGFLLKDTDHETLLAGIRTIHAGESLLSGTITRRLIGMHLHGHDVAVKRDRLLALLTPREMDVLTEVARGRTNEEVAVALSITHATAKTHISRILSKLDARDRVQLVIVAYESGLVGERDAGAQRNAAAWIENSSA